MFRKLRGKVTGKKMPLNGQLSLMKNLTSNLKFFKIGILFGKNEKTEGLVWNFPYDYKSCAPDLGGQPGLLMTIIDPASKSLQSEFFVCVFFFFFLTKVWGFSLDKIFSGPLIFLLHTLAIDIFYFLKCPCFLAQSFICQLFKVHIQPTGSKISLDHSKVNKVAEYTCPSVKYCQVRTTSSGPLGKHRLLHRPRTTAQIRAMIHTFKYKIIHK